MWLIFKNFLMFIGGMSLFCYLLLVIWVLRVYWEGREEDQPGRVFALVRDDIRRSGDCCRWPSVVHEPAGFD